MPEKLNNLQRTHTCGELHAGDIDKQVVLMGWVHRRRDLGRVIFLDLREAGEYVGHNRVARIMRLNGIQALRGYKAPRYLASMPSVTSPNLLNRQFTVERPDTAWVTDITYIRT